MEEAPPRCVVFGLGRVEVVVVRDRYFVVVFVILID
jgi:hypothetical protein